MSNLEMLLASLVKGEKVPLEVLKDAAEEEGRELPWRWIDRWGGKTLQLPGSPSRSWDDLGFVDKTYGASYTQGKPVFSAIIHYEGDICKQTINGVNSIEEGMRKSEEGLVENIRLGRVKLP